MQCIRCGREIPENEMLCRICKMPPATVTPEDLPAAPSKKEARREARAAVRQQRKERTYKPKVVRRLALALTVSVLLHLAVCVLAYHYYDRYLDAEEDLRVRKASVQKREDAADKRDESIRELEERLKKAQQEIASLESSLASAESR